MCESDVDPSYAVAVVSSTGMGLFAVRVDFLSAFSRPILPPTRLSLSLSLSLSRCLAASQI